MVGDNVGFFVKHLMVGGWLSQWDHTYNTVEDGWVIYSLYHAKIKLLICFWFPGKLFYCHVINHTILIRGEIFKYKYIHIQKKLQHQKINWCPSHNTLLHSNIKSGKSS